MNKSYKFLIFLLILAPVFMFSSCIKDTYTQQVNDEKKQIETYINAQYPGTTPLNSYGMYYISKTAGTGDSATLATDYVVIRYTAKFLDGTIFDSTDTTVVLSSGYYRWLEIGGPFTFSMGSNFYGWVDGIRKMQEGGRSIMVIPSTLSFGDFKPRIYDITLLKVYHNIAASRKLEFDSTFMVPMGFDIAKDSTGGIFKRIDSTSMAVIGVHYPQIGDTIEVKYKGMILDSITANIPRGRTFYIDDSLTYIIGSSSTPPFDNAMPSMKTGMKASVYVPFYNAYGSSTMYDNNTGQIALPPYSNLMYNVEFVGFVTKINNKLVLNTSRN